MVAYSGTPERQGVNTLTFATRAYGQDASELPGRKGGKHANIPQLFSPDAAFFYAHELSCQLTHPSLIGTRF